MSNLLECQHYTKLENALAFAIGGDWGKDSAIAPDYVKVKVIRGTDLTNWEDTKGANAAERFIKKSSLEKRRLHCGDIVIEISGGGPTQPVGRSILIDSDFLKSVTLPVVCSNFFRKISTKPDVNPGFVNYYLTYSHTAGKLDEYQTQTTNLRNLNFSRLTAEFDIPLPDKTIQDRVTKRLEKVLPQIKNTQSRLESIPSLLKRFRQSVLYAGCTGRLTTDWRKVNTPKHAPEENNSLTGWETISAESVFNFITSGSRGWAEYYSDAGAIFLRIGNLDHDSIKLDLASIQHVSPPKNTEGIRTRVKKGDILISITADVGMVAYIDYDIDEAYINQHIALARPNNLLDSRFLAYYIAQNSSQKQLQGLQRGATKVGLTLGDIRKLQLTVPKSREEQKEIVRRIEALLTYADKIENEYTSAKTKADKMTQSILSKAFRGELRP